MGVHGLFLHQRTGVAMILSAPQYQGTMKDWLCDRIGLTPSSDLVCIGNMLGGKLRAVVGYEGYNGASSVIHVAGEGNWCTKDYLRVVFDYPFRTCEVNMLIGLVPSGNVEAIRFNTHIGFRTDAVLKGAHPDGALLIMTLKRDECRFLNPIRSRHGKEEQPAARA